MVTRVVDDAAGLGPTVLDSTGLAPSIDRMLRRTADRLSSEGGVCERRAWDTVATGFASLDQLLPAGGVRRGSVIEWLACGEDAAGDAGGAISLACAVACRLAAPSLAEARLAAPSRLEHSQASTIVVVDRGQRFYPPAVIPWIVSGTVSGVIDGAAQDVVSRDFGTRSGRRPQLVVARPSRDDDELWTIDQALRCPGVAAVLAWPSRVHATAMRRWQLATRASGAVGLLVRGLSPRSPVRRGAARAHTTWADAKLSVTPVIGGADSDLAVRRLRISLMGGPWSVGEAIQREMSHERSKELLLDLTNGREASGRCRMPDRAKVPVAGRHPHAGRFQQEDVACRAS